MQGAAPASQHHTEVYHFLVVSQQNHHSVKPHTLDQHLATILRAGKKKAGRLKKKVVWSIDFSGCSTCVGPSISAQVMGPVTYIFSNDTLSY